MTAPSTSWFTLGDAVREHAITRGSAPAIVCGEVRLTWSELDRRVDRAAAALAAAGVEAGDRVLWLGQNCHRLLELLLAAGRLGAALCPANWRLSAEELAFVVDDLEPRVVVWQEAEIGERVRAARAVARAAGGATWVRHDARGPDTYEASLDGAGDPRTPPGDAAVDAERPVLVLYTAAFDGRPNGALLPHRALIAQSILAIATGTASPSDVYLCCGPLFHVGTLKAALATLVAGGVNVVTPRVDPVELCRLVDAERCTGAFLQPVTREAMAEANRDGRFDLSSLRPRGAVRSGYGQTELAGVVTVIDPARPCIGSAGRPVAGARIEVLDAAGMPAAAGEVGEIAVRGPMVMSGYHRRPELTAARRAGGWHHTGDLGRREADGSLSFVGPMTRLVKTGAENVYPAEVEACLREHPAVAEAAVIGVPDPVWGQAVTAVVALLESGSVRPEDLVDHCRNRIASYKKPRSVRFVSALPRRGGAVDYDALDAAHGGGGYPGTGR
jgi:acyl-CoA synthetase (AMP-forming)/AMP-acid ligase II